MNEQEIPERLRDWLLVSESFYTHQGEGPSTGQPAFFLRLGACNLNCYWCDTPYTWVFDDRHVSLHGEGRKYDPTAELKRVTIHDAADQVLASSAPLLVITGGEPMLQQCAVALLFDEVHSRDSTIRFEIETAGTIPPRELKDTLAESYGQIRYNVSLKLAGSRNELERRRVPEAINELKRYDSVFKFVITPNLFAEDLAEVSELIDEFELPGERIWLMPEGRTAEEVTDGLHVLAPIALRNGWNLTARTHIYIYGDKRGH